MLPHIQQGFLGESMLRYCRMVMMAMKRDQKVGERSCGTAVVFTPRRFGAQFLGSIIEVLGPGVASASSARNAFLGTYGTGGSTRNSALRGRFSNLWALCYLLCTIQVSREMFSDRTSVVIQVNLY